MKHIFLFFGAHNGLLVNRLDKLTNEDKLYGPDISWDEIHLYEPQPEHEQSLIDLSSKDLRIRYHKIAVSTYEGTASFYVKGDPSMGYCSSTLDDKKFSGQLFETITVDVVDVVKWIRDNTSENDFVAIDMDIECEEYNLLPALINSDIMDRVKFVSVEFHRGKSHRWSYNGLDSEIALDVKHALRDKFLDHDKYYG
jgi:FkbM family methyltransferase